jgi:hypothetical protein
VGIAGKSAFVNIFWFEVAIFWVLQAKKLMNTIK